MFCNFIKDQRKAIFSLHEKFIFLLIVNIGIFFILFSLRPILFETNDDIGMLLIASGGYSGTPDAHLVFINYIYGLFVSFLYTFYPGWEWYTILFISIHIISLSIISWKIINSRVSSIRKIIFILLFYSIEYYCVQLLQFTTTSAILALSSIILLQSNKIYYKIIAIIFFLFASFIRFEAAFLVLIISSPLIFLEIKKQRYHINKLIPTFLILSQLLILPVLFKVIDNEIYKNDKDWAEYKMYNYYRGKINDNPNHLANKDLPPNMYDSDYELLRMFFPDTEIIDIHNMKSIFDATESVSFKQKIKNIPPSALYANRNLLLLISALVFIQFFFLKRRNLKYVLLFSLLLFYLIFCYVSMDGIFKDRVFIAALLPLCWVVFRSENTIHANRIGVILSSIFIILLSWYFVRPSNFREVTFHSYEKLLTKSLPKVKNHIVPYTISLKLEFCPAFQVTQTISDKKIISSGWLSKIPFNEGKVTSYMDFVDKNAIFIDKSDEVSILLLKESILKHYNINTRVNILEEDDHNMIFNFTQID